MKKYTSIILLFALLSCELTVDVDVPFDQAQLTVNSFFNPDSLWSATLTLNRHILSEASYERIEGGFVVVYREGLPIDTLMHLADGFYKSDTGKPLPGTQYEMRASNQDYVTAIGISEVPSPALLTNVKVTPVQPTQDAYYNSKIEITFQDNEAEVNYYNIFVETESESYNPRTGIIHTHRGRVYMESEDPTIEETNSDWVDGILLKDVFFNGQEIKFPFHLWLNDAVHTAVTTVTVQTVSEDYFNYQTTFRVQQNTSGDPFAQPVNVYNNIEGGFGIFAGFSESKFIYRSNPKPIITSISPEKGRPGDHLTIYGENFVGASEDFYVVQFSNDPHVSYSNAVRISDNELDVIVPDRVTTGKIILYGGGRVAISEIEFEITP